MQYWIVHEVDKSWICGSTYSWSKKKKKDKLGLIPESFVVLNFYPETITHPRMRYSKTSIIQTGQPYTLYKRLKNIGGWKYFEVHPGAVLDWNCRTSPDRGDLHQRLTELVPGIWLAHRCTDTLASKILTTVSLI